MKARLLRALFRLLSLLPLRVAQALGGGLGWLAYHLHAPARRVTEINLRRCLPELSAEERARLACSSLMESAKTFTEMGPLWLWPEQRVLALMREVEGEEPILAELARGKGVILATPHLGAWEMAGLYIARRFPVTTLYRPPRVRELDAFIRAARERTGATLVPTDAGGVRALYRALAQGEVVAVLPDQDPGRGGGVFAPFFGQPAWTMALLSRLATRSGAPVFFGFARRLPRGDGYRLEFLPALAATTSVELTESAAAVNAAVEVCVRRVPAQYQWSYKRFKTRPPGEPRWY